MKYNELTRLLKKNGCKFVRHDTNHDRWKSKNGVEFEIPRHSGQEVRPGTLNSILKAAGLK
jgi:predicted RNA binding protein YcfA (HicA-like mRNA interferase family)